MLALTLVLLAAAPPGPEGPRLGHWTVDTARALRPETIGRLDEVAAKLDASGRAQLALCVVPTTGAVRPAAFARQVFDAWQLGHPGRRDGVLVLVELKGRTAELVLGDGAPVSTSQAEDVKRDDLEPYLRSDVDTALLYATRDLAQLLAPTNPASFEQQEQAGREEVLLRIVRGEQMYAERSPRHWVIDLSDTLNATQRADLERVSNDLYGEDHGRLFFLIVNSTRAWPGLDALVSRLVTQVGPYSSQPAGVVALNVADSSAALVLPGLAAGWDEQQARDARDRLQRRAHDAPAAALLEAGTWAADVMTHGVPPRNSDQVVESGLRTHAAPLAIGAVLVFALGVGLFWAWWTRRPRICRACGRPRERLDEVKDDEYLDAAQQAQELEGSADYVVWRCGACRDVEILRHTAWRRVPKTCPACGAAALATKSKPLSWPTAAASGSLEVIETCGRCPHSATSIKAIPKLHERHG